MFMEKITWPENNRCSVMITVNLSAEFFWLQINPEAINMPRTLSMGEYGMSRGLDRVLSVLETHNIKATFFVPGQVAKNYATQIRDIFSRGHEIASMGYSHENYGVLPPEAQRDYLEKSIAAIKNCCGTAPKGFRAPMGDLTIDTLEIAKTLGIEYSSNLSEDDRPFWKIFGKNNLKILEIPIHWALYDLPYFALNFQPAAFPSGQGRIANYTGVLDNWKDEFAGYYNYGLCYVLQIDPQTIGTPGRIKLFEELCDYIATFDSTWFATGGQMVDYFNGN